MAPQLRRSSRQQQAPDAQPAAADTAADKPLVKSRKLSLRTPVDSQQQPDQQGACDDEVLPPSKAPRRANTSPRGAVAAPAAAAAPAAPAAPAVAAVAAVAALPPGLSKIEIERAARIAANKARLAELELPQLAAGLAATAAAAAAARRKPAGQQRGISSKRSRTSEVLPQRQSARTRGQAPDPTLAGGIDYEARDGRVVLAAFVPERYASTAGGPWDAALAGMAASKPPPGPLEFNSSNGDADTDAAFLQQLRSYTSAGAGTSAAAAAAAAGGGGVMGVEQVSKLRLQSVDVAKLTTQGISCLAFHPSSIKPIVAAADKSGKVALWDINHTAPKADDQAGGGSSSSSSSSSGYDGVLMFEPHRDYVSSMRWLGPSGQGLLTGSYDGVVRRLDVETGVWDLVGGVPADLDDCNWSAGDATPDGSTIYLATSDGHLSLMDTRASNVTAGPHLNIANRKVNTLHLHSDQVHLLGASSDGTVAVWDVRQLAKTSDAVSSSSSSQAKTCKPVAAGHHMKSSQGAYWEPGGGRRVLSISFDDTLKIWNMDAASLTQQVSIRHNNNTGRWVMPFRPSWCLAGDGVCVGDLKRGVGVFRDDGLATTVLTAEALTAIPSRLAMHSDGLLAAATSSGRVHIFR